MTDGDQHDARFRAASIVLQRRRRARQSDGAGSILLGLAVLSVVGLVIAVAFTALSVGSAAYSDYADDYIPITQRVQTQAGALTAVYDRYGPDDGAFLGYLANPSGAENRPVELADISPWMVTATLSTEDDEFTEHKGVNVRGSLRAVVSRFTTGEIDSGGGGSSITQQLVKILYLTTDCRIEDGRQVCVAPRTMDRKLREMVYAIEVEKELTKDEIIELYLNRVSYADRYIGVESAAHGYFRKTAANLTLAEAALLAGIPSAPGTYHPRENCTVDAAGACVVDEQGRTTLVGPAKDRQEQVLDLMVEHGHITQAEADAAKLETLIIWPKEDTSRASAWIDNQIEPRLERMCLAGTLPMIPGTSNCLESVRAAGYQVTTTLDTPLNNAARQRAATEIAAGLDAGCDCHNAAVVTIDPPTGEIVVYVENVDPSSTDPRVSGNIDQLTEINQPGSSFKPVVYMAWMEYLKRAPMSSLWDTNPLTLEEEDDEGGRPTPTPDPDVEEFKVTNSRPHSGPTDGLQTMRSALGGSQNVGAFRAASEVGIDNVIEMAKRLGITTLQPGFDPTFYNHSLTYYGPAIATGGANIRAVDMAYVDATIANMGTMVGTPTLAQTIDLNNLRDSSSTAADDDDLIAQRRAFQRGMTRLPGTRTLDPVVILSVADRSGNVVFQQGEPERVEAVNAGTAWMLHSVMSDCKARHIIWSCGSSNTDLTLDFFLNGVKIPSGVKTGTQQGFTDSDDTLETWMTSYTRNSATAVWVGNADNSLVRDGRAGNFASANTTVRLMKGWMSDYHSILQERGVLPEVLTFDELQPRNVTFGPFPSATTEDGRRGGCSQEVDGWFRTDIDYGLGDCEVVEVDARNGRRATDDTPRGSIRDRTVVRLPALREDLAVQLARRFGLPVAPFGDGGSYAPPPVVPTSPPQTTVPPTAINTPVPSPAAPAATRVPPAPTSVSEPTTVPQPTAAPAPDEGNNGNGTGGNNGNGNGGGPGPTAQPGG